MKQPNKEPDPQDKTRIQSNQSTNSGEVQAQEHVPLPEQFELMGTLGQGGMGTVYKARNKYTERVVAIKMLSSTNISEEVLLRFQREAKAIAKLEHPNVVSLFDFGVASDGSPYCVMEFTKGRDLGQILKDKGTLEEIKVADIFVQVCAGLDHAHQQGIIHRDLKPSNIILAEVTPGNFKAKVLDFGIAKLNEADDATPGAVAGATGLAPGQKLTKTGFIVGTPLYMSPEQCEGGKVDGRSDIYAMGAVMYECLCGKPPHQGASAIETMLLRMSEEPLSFKERGANISEDMEAIVRKCLQKNPADRFPSTVELSTALASRRPQKKKNNAPPIVIDKRILIGVGALLGVVALYMFLAPRITEQFSQLNLTPQDLYMSKALDKDRVHVKTNSLSPRGMALLALDTELTDLDISHWPEFDDKQLALLQKLQLKSLNLNTTNVTDGCVATLKNMPTLEALNLSNTKIGDVAVSQILAALPNLRSLNISHTKVDANVIAMLGKNGEASKLENIGLAGLPKVVHGNDLIKLQSLPVTVWDFSDDNLDDGDVDTISEFKSTKTLLLNNNPLTTASLIKLLNLPNLEMLAIKGPKLKAEDLFNFRKAIRDAQRVCIIQPNDDDRLKEKFRKGAPRVSEIDMQGRNISNQGMAVLAQPQAHSLKNVSFSKCFELGDAGVANLQGLPIESLNLDSTGISDASIKVISSLKNLYDLSLADTKVGNLAELGKLSNLNYLNLTLVKNITSVPTLSQMRELRKLLLPGSDRASARLFIAMLKNSKVTECNFAECKLDDSDIDGIAQATQLRRIDLSTNDISGASIMKLATFPELEILRIKKCPKITSTDISEFLSAGPKHVKIEAGQ